MWLYLNIYERCDEEEEYSLPLIRENRYGICCEVVLRKECGR